MLVERGVGVREKVMLLNKSHWLRTCIWQRDLLIGMEKARVEGGGEASACARGMVGLGWAEVGSLRVRRPWICTRLEAFDLWFAFAE